MTITDIDKQFDDKLNELKQDQDFINDGETKIHEFGYRRKSIDGIVETITDFGNIKKFIMGISLDVKKLLRYDFYVDCDENGEYQTDIREVKDGEFIKLKDVLSIFRK